MKMHVIGSGSSGNCYALVEDKGDQILLLEAGRPIGAVKEALNFRMSDVVGVFVTHEHGDHAGHIGRYMRAMRCQCYMSEGTHKALNELHQQWLGNGERITNISHGETIKVGNFSVTALALRNSKGEPTHDAEEPMCYLIQHEEMGAMLFATDTYMMPYRVRGLSTIMIECNYDEDKLEQNCKDGIIDPKRRKRTITSHMSLTNCKVTLSKMDMSACKRVILCHISHDNGIVTRFKEECGQICGKPIKTALDGVKINLDR